MIADDIIIYGVGDTAGKAWQDSDEKMMSLSDRLKEEGAKINRDKIKLHLFKIKYMGHLLTTEGIKQDPTKIQGLRDLPYPKDKQDVKWFLCTANYLAKFVYACTKFDQCIYAREEIKELWDHITPAMIFKKDKEKSPLLKCYRDIAWSWSINPVMSRCHSRSNSEDNGYLQAISTEQANRIRKRTSEFTKFHRSYLLKWERMLYQQGKPYLVVVDYMSHYIEVVKPVDEMARTIIAVRKAILARHNIPICMKSDNSQYPFLYEQWLQRTGSLYITPKAMERWSQRWKCHIPQSPYHSMYKLPTSVWRMAFPSISIMRTDNLLTSYTDYLVPTQYIYFVDGILLHMIK